MPGKIGWPKRPTVLLYPGLRYASSSTTHDALLLQRPLAPKVSPLAVLPTKTLIYSVLFTSVMSSPLLNPSLSLLKYVIESNSSLLHPSRNPVMNYLLRATIYNHFCAGENEAEVRKSVKAMKNLGFKGVILGYARESIAKVEDLDPQAASVKTKQDVLDRAVDEWKDGNLRTLRMIGEGDFLGIKFTGAGPMAVEALTRGDPIPPRIQQAIEEICRETAAQGSRLWIDAEQQIFQSAIDTWTIDLMRQFNQQGTVVVYNTIQAYLKSSTDNVTRHLRLAQAEGWTLGIKLVRGAYIAHDYRTRIHDTKSDTDNNYNHIVKSLLTRQFPTEEEQSAALTQAFPDVRLFVASNNAESARKAHRLYAHRVLNRLPTIPVELGQLQGMADEVSCELLAHNAAGGAAAAAASSQGQGQGRVAEAAAPGVFKCLAWGTLEECLHFLLRRAVENRSAMERTRHTAAALRKEAWRRLRW